MQYKFYFGQAYGEGAYGESTYSCTTQQQQAGQCTVAAGSGSGNSGSGASGLVNTGIAVAAFVTLACLLGMIAIVVRIWRKPKKALAPAVADDSREDIDPRS